MLPTPMNPTERAMRASLGDLRDDGVESNAPSINLRDERSNVR
jgi:hypothetical protein